MIYLITGKKRAGKDTLGDVAVEISDNCFKESLAEPMKNIAEFLFPWGCGEMDEGKEKIDPNYGISPRQFLQVFGTDFMQTYLSEKFPEYKQKIGRKFWADKLISLLKECKPNGNFFVTDVRFPHEVEAFKEAFGDKVKVIRIERPGLPAMDPHPSEQEMDSIIPDYTLFNAGTLEEYTSLCKDFLENTIDVIPKGPIYIAGPVSSNPNFRTDFKKVEQKLINDGWEVFNPIEVTDEENLPWEEYMKLDIPVLMKCKAVYMMKGWRYSKGAKLERDLADTLGMEIIYEEDE